MDTLQTLNITDLPDDMLLEICMRLNSRELAKLVGENKKIYRVCSEEMARRKAHYIKYRQKMALPLSGKCDNPSRLLELVCKGILRIKNDHSLELVVAHYPRGKGKDDKVLYEEMDFVNINFDSTTQRWLWDDRFGSKDSGKFHKINKKLIQFLGRRKKGLLWDVSIREDGDIIEESSVQE